jgi:hypothetical protein
MLINFTLVPVEKVQPWGSPGNPSLSWFGLTDGQYWIQAGESTLFEYSDHAQVAGAPRYCDYQVVRLYEDLMEMLQHILEPVPTSLVQYISGDTGIAWLEGYRLWAEQNADQLKPDGYWEIIDASTTWIGKRSLDSAYLSPSANIVIWSDAVNVYFEWDNRTKLFKGQTAWTALRGTYKLPRHEFVAEIQSFHLRLMEQMAHRVGQVLSGALAAEINIDLAGLEREQKERCSTLDGVLSSPAQTDWQSVEMAINEILNAQNGRQV